MYKIEIAANKKDLCGESPLWTPDCGKLYWVDIARKCFHSYAVDTGAVDTQAPGIAISALALTPSCDLVAAVAEGIWIVSQNGRPVLIANRHRGEILSINDGIADPHGRFLCGSTFFDGSVGGYPLGKLYSVDTDGTISILDDGFALANGMGFSPDERTLYVTDSIARVIYAYDYDSRSGKARDRRTLVKVPSTEGLPDGLTVDAEGFIWSAQSFGGCICRYDPGGKLRQSVPIPAEQVSSVAFGGREFFDIFVTSAAQPDALAFAPRGYTPSPGRVGGQLFRFRSDVQGRPEYVCRIQIAADSNTLD